MRGVYTTEEIRAGEEILFARLPEGTLMQRASYGLAVECAALLGTVYGARVVLLVGAGNNGGDALFAGAVLARRGAAVTALLLDESRVHAGGLAALRAAGGVLRPALPQFVAADLVVDGILGIGGRGGLRAPAADLASAARGSLTVAVDLPSGVEADTGAVPGEAVHADVSVTFGALKPGLVLGRGAELAGSVRLVDIGLEAVLAPASLRVLEAQDVRAVLPVPGALDDKYTRGVVGVVAGSPQYGGAGVLATGSALAGGAGMVRYAGQSPEAIRARYPEVVVHDDARPHELRVQSWVVGPGMGTGGTARGLLADVLGTPVPVIVDADAITVLADSPGLLPRSAPTVLTPHDREFERLAGALDDDRLGAARRASAALGATVLLKGNATVIAAPDGSAFVNPTGTPWLGTAGSGDVLSGLIGALLASGLDPTLAAAVGSYVHGVAGQLAAADGPPTSVDILNSLRSALHVIVAT
jgi:hydroxyethylthiazole kinase-like uncharacterized protein yjeF